MSAEGPFYLRWHPTGLAPRLEAFADLDAALDAVEARWEEIRHHAPQILDRRKILLITTEQLEAAMIAEDAGEGGQSEEQAQL